MSGPRLRPFWSGLATGALLALPFLALLPAGYAWAWERGLLLHWLAGAALCSGVAALVWRRRRPRDRGDAEPIVAAPSPTWSPRDQAAFVAVEAIAQEVDGTVLGDGEALLALGRRIVEAVARHYHGPGEQAVLAFTLPEALLLSERVSRELRRLIVENVPASHVLKLGHLVRGYGWRSYIGEARRLYDAYRAVRPIVNPLHALLLEIRGQLTGEILSTFTQATTTRIARLIVLEIGRGAIDLYGGRLRLTEDELAGYRSPAAKRDEDRAPGPPEPLRLLLAGQVSVGKSALVNGLSGEVRAAVDVLPATRSFTPYALVREGQPAAVLLDAPGLGADDATLDDLAREAAECDLVLWVAAANRPAREIDARALARLRAEIQSRPDRRAPPILAVLTHIDRLRPFAEWAPPYDLRGDGGAKAASIREALAAVAEDLGFATQDIVPVCLSDAAGRYNIDAVWARIAALLPEARAAQLTRVLAAAGQARDWRRIWSQALGAGRVLVKVWRE